MADAKKIDPFKPVQPAIPGVPLVVATKKKFDSPPALPPDSPAPAPKAPPNGLWIAVGALAVLIIGGLWFWHSGSTSSPRPVASDAATLRPADAETRKAPADLPLGPGIIGTTSELAKPWSSKRFLFRGPLSADPVPALVVHLPNGQYWGISMIEPFGTCKLQYVTDLQALDTEYDFRADHPMVADPCTHAVFDLLQYDGGAPNGGLVRGAIVHGTGVRPPLAIEIEIQGKQVRAIRME